MEGRAIIVILVKLDTGIGHFAHLLQLHCKGEGRVPRNLRSLLIFLGFLLLRDIDVVSASFSPPYFFPFCGEWAAHETKKDGGKRNE